MKVLKIIFITLLIIIAVPLIIAAFAKKEYVVKREVVVNQPKDEVFEYLRFLKNHDNFSVWNSMDPAMEKTYTGTDGTEGFMYRWVSNHESVGTGEQEIIKIRDGEQVEYELRFIEPFASTSAAYISTEAIGPDQTKVSWSFNGHMSYPTNLMLVFMDFDQMIGNDLQTGLNNLKYQLES